MGARRVRPRRRPNAHSGTMNLCASSSARSPHDTLYARKAKPCLIRPTSSPRPSASSSHIAYSHDARQGCPMGPSGEPRIARPGRGNPSLNPKVTLPNLRSRRAARPEGRCDRFEQSLVPLPGACREQNRGSVLNWCKLGSLSGAGFSALSPSRPFPHFHRSW